MSATDIDTDVIVIGAGPIGLALAGLLAADGVRVTVLESRDIAGDLPRAISIVDETFRTLEQLGLADALKAESRLNTGARYFGRNDVPLAISNPVGSKLGHPAKSQFDQPVLESLLWDSTLADSRIEFLHSTTATAIRQDTAGVTVTASVNGQDRDLRASWVVGADGGRSFTRSALGIELVGSTQVEKWIVVDLDDVPETFEDYADFHCNATRPVVVVPGIKGRLRFEFQVLPGDDEDAIIGFESIRELCRPYTSVREEQVRRASIYVAHQRLAATYRQGRGFLVGDAAHLMPPFAGQGLNAGMRDAANLAWKLAAAVQGRATQQLLDSYEAERRPHAAAMVRISHHIGQVVMMTDERKAKLRDAAFTGLKVLPSVKSYLANMRFISPPAYAKLPGAAVVRPGVGVDGALASLVGRSLPQPRVRTADGSEFGLDALLQGGWRLIAVGGGIGTDPFIGIRPEWRGLESGRVVLRGADTTLGTPSTDLGYHEAVDGDGLLAPADGRLSETQYLLVRPDKYVAAAFTIASQTAVIDGIREFTTLDSVSHL